MSRNKYIIRLVFLLTKANAQVFNGNLDLTSQAQVDAFNYTSVTGYVNINDAVDGNITNLNGLSELTTVGAYLSIAGNNAIVNISGLSGLTTIGENFIIQSNAALINLDGLFSLTSITSFFNIINNASLSDIDGIYNLSSVGGDLSIQNNTALSQFCGLYTLFSVSGLGGILNISGNGSNPTLQQVIDGGICNITLASQAEVDAFNFVSLTSNLTIDETSAGNITNLDGLSELTTVGGNLVINNNSAFTSVDGLSNLSSIGGFLFFSQNASLLNLNGLSNLNSVVSDLVILQNTSLTEFCGLYQLLSVGGLGGSYNVEGNAANPTQSDIIDGGLCITVYVGDLTLTNQAEDDAFHYSSVTGYLSISDSADGDIDINNLNSLLELTSVEGFLDIFNNDALTNIDGLSSLTSVGGKLDIYSNSALTNINGFSNLTSVGGYLFINDNNALTNSDGFSSLTSVGEELFINDNDALTNIDGLSNLSSVGDNLVLLGNDALTNINGLSNLTSVGGDVFVQDNTALLEFCGLYNLLSSSGLGGTCNVGGNALNPTPQEIINGGPCTTDASDNEAEILPVKYDLSQNYPNSFNPATIISWQLPSRSHVVLKIYDILGNEVATLVNENKEAGYYETKFDGSALTSGLYIYRLTSENYISTKKMLMIK